MHIGWPQGLILALILMGVGVALAKDGEPKGNWSVGYSLVGAAINIGLLWWGGFFA